MTIPRRLADEMLDHCLAERPNEACGLLAAKDGLVVKVFQMRNVEGSPVRYRFDDMEQMKVEDAIDAAGLELMGVYHSHTRTAAYPSPTDVRRAAYDVAYVIVSLAKAKPSIKAFRIKKENWFEPEGEIEELPVEILD